ncbi:MAG: TonB-dependent receptor [Bacteroidota bacterium]
MRKFTLLVLCGLLGGFSFAQVADEPSDSIYWNLDIDDVVVTAQYAPTSVKNTVHPIKVLKMREIQQQGQLNLAEVLANQLNLRVSNDPILGNGLLIQGIGGENIQILIDNVPVIGRVGGNVDLSQINLQNVKQIEIIEGAMSAQYGSNASGGVINIITHTSQVEKWQIETQHQYENVGIQNHTLRVGYQHKKLYAALGGAYNNNQFAPVDSLRLQTETLLPSGQIFNTKKIPWNPKKQFDINASLRYRISDSTNITYQYRWFDEQLKNYGEIRRARFRPYAFDEIYNTHRNTHSLTLESYLIDQLYLKSVTAFNYYHRRKETQRLDIEPNTNTLIESGLDTLRFRSILHRMSLSSSNSRMFSGQLGLEFLHESGTGERILDNTAELPKEATITNLAIWSSLRYQRNRVVAQANLRYGYNNKYTHPLIPSFHFNWKIRPNWQLQSGIAAGFRAPSIKELYFNFIDVNHYIVGNPDLKAERSKNVFLSINHQLSLPQKHQLEVVGKLFYNYIDNRIIIAEFAPVQFNYQNIEQFETNGLNLQLRYHFKKHVAFQSGLAYTNLYNTWSSESSTRRFTPLYELQQQLSWNMPKQLGDLVLVHRFIGQQIRFYEDGEGTVSEGYVGGYHLLNATWSRHFWKRRVFLAVGAKNLLNIETVPFLGQSDTAHGSVGNTQLLNWGRTYFVRCSLNISSR